MSSEKTMDRLFKTMESVARMVVCAPTPEGYAIEKLSKPQRLLHRSALFFDVVDFFDMIFDTILGFRMTLSGDRPIFGIFLLGGIIIARIVASKGKRVLLRGGLQWAPFFQDRRKFYQRVGPDTALPALFALLFTEISIFMFEDATILSIWIATESFDKNDIFDRLNAWFTLLSVAMCLSLLLCSVLAWLRLWKWEPDICSIVCQILHAVTFLAIFGIIVFFLASLVFMGFQTIAGKDGVETKNPFLILVSFSWIFGSFFACTLRQRSRVPLVQPASWRDDDQSNVTACDQQHDNTLSDRDSSGQSDLEGNPLTDASVPSGTVTSQLGQQAVMVAIGPVDSNSGESIEASIPFADAVLIDSSEAFDKA